ncbi:hypothetical protein POM88_052054 [Heracleum sosnowskyi]|uniref:Uncharacterized protein n=1 Tax=Heracleum sosnowskyi TaxID=360622 RepID=A0AAD8LZ68_9APIA|nr:hypothetical protein POM88_052054 [Heracleum sosnowskyi]
MCSSFLLLIKTSLLRLLVTNRSKLLRFFNDFHFDKEDEDFKSDKAQVVREIETLEPTTPSASPQRYAAVFSSQYQYHAQPTPSYPIRVSVLVSIFHNLMPVFWQSKVSSQVFEILCRLTR